MLIIGIVVAAVVAFVLSSLYYPAVTPLERRVLGADSLDRGRPQTWKVISELVRTTVVAGVFAWVARHAGLLTVPASLELALIIWIGFPVVLLTGSIMWERVPPVTAIIHAGDWLLKLAVIALSLALWH